MNNNAVHIHVHFRLEGSVLQDGVNVTVWEVNPLIYNYKSSHFIAIQTSGERMWIKIPRDNPNLYSIGIEKRKDNE